MAFHKFGGEPPSQRKFRRQPGIICGSTVEPYFHGGFFLELVASMLKKIRQGLGGSHFHSDTPDQLVLSVANIRMPVSPLVRTELYSRLKNSNGSTTS